MSESKELVMEDQVKELSEEEKESLKKLINKHERMIFMKGTLKLPMCDYSQKMLDIVKKITNDFETFDILDDNFIREGLKTYSNWPTYPQLYVRGELVGGVDTLTVLQMKPQELKNRIKPPT